MAYRIEYARSGRSGCKGPKACKESSGNKIEKGALRLATVVEIRGERTFYYRHWGCVTDTVVQNILKNFDDPEDLDGFEDMNEEDQEKLKFTFANGHIPPADITPALLATADSEEDEDGTKKKKKSKSSKKKNSNAVKDENDFIDGVDGDDEDFVEKKLKAKSKSSSKAGEKPSTSAANGTHVPKKKGRQSEAEESVPSLDAHSSDPPSPKKRGRPPKREIVEPSAPKKRGRPSKADKMAQAAAPSTVDRHEGHDDASESGSKKIGRPSKADKAAAEALSNSNDSAFKTSTATDTDAEVSDMPAPKKRGRPKKQVDPSAEPKVPKKRGRPKKEVDPNAEPKVPSKRGRPKKNAEASENEPSSGSAAPASDDVVPPLTDAESSTDTSAVKKRGRPKKVDTEDAEPKNRGRPKKEQTTKNDVSTTAEEAPAAGASEVVSTEKRGRGRPKKSV